MEDFIPLVAIVSIFGTITAIFFGPSYLKSRDRREMQETVRRSIEKGDAIPTEMVEAMSKFLNELPSRTRDIRRGVILIAIGVGIAAANIVGQMSWGDNGIGDDGRLIVGGIALSLATIPVTLGLAFIVLSFFNKNKD